VRDTQDVFKFIKNLTGAGTIHDKGYSLGTRFGKSSSPPSIGLTFSTGKTIRFFKQKKPIYLLTINLRWGNLGD